MVSTLGQVIVLVAGTAYVGYFKFDIGSLVLNCFSSSFFSQSKVLRIASFLRVIHEGQMLIMIIRMLGFLILYQFIIMIFLIRGMLKKSLSLNIIKIFQEIEIVLQMLYSAVSALTALILSFAFICTLLCTLTIYVGFKQNNLALALPCLVMTCISIAFVQVTFAIGCIFFTVSRSLFRKWKTEASLYKQSGVSRTQMSRMVKSLRVIYIPAGNFGIIDTDIKMNYMNNLLENIVDILLTSNNVLF